MRWIVLSVLVVGGVAAAQGPRDRVGAEVRALTVEGLVQESGLDAATGQKVGAIWERYADAIQPLRRHARQTLAALQGLVQLGNATAAQLDQLTTQLLEDRVKIQTLEHQRQGEIRKLLGPAAFARWILAWPRVHRAIMMRIGRGMAGDDSE